jgi:hypothetical protein
MNKRRDKLMLIDCLRDYLSTGLKLTAPVIRLMCRGLGLNVGSVTHDG